MGEPIMDKQCGTCEYAGIFVQVNIPHPLPARAPCLFPLPFWVEQKSVRKHDGAGCPCYREKEAP